MAETPHNLLGSRAEEMIGDVLNKREESIINSVCASLISGKTLDAQFAIQQWLAIAEARTLRRSLVNRTKQENSRIASQS
jgi:hypothetical protein